jgi:DNA-binding LacI/PurR family transcriptional regulator
MEVVMNGAAQQKNVIGILSWSMNAFFVRRLYKGIEGVLAGSGYKIKIFEVGHLDAESYHQTVHDLADRPDLAGLIYGHLRLNVNQVARFKQRGIPVVACTERMEGIDWVTVDEVTGAYLATRYLRSLGHRRIALINGPIMAFQSRQREEGFLKALNEDGINFATENGVRMLSFTEEEGREAAHMLLDLPCLPTAIFVAAGDVTALGVLTALRERKVAVPSNISVVGYDNLEFAKQLVPPLTTVNQPLETMGAWAAHRMHQALKDPANHRPRGEIFEPDLIIRSSANRLEMTRPLESLESMEGQFQGL